MEKLGGNQIRVVSSMKRKVTKIGNSLGVTMTDALNQISADHGDSVDNVQEVIAIHVAMIT